MSFNTRGKGQPIAKIGKQVIYLDPNDKLGVREIKAKTNDEIRQLPNTEGRDVAYIAGQSGSGKSTYAADLVERYNKLYPDNKVYLLSKIKDDPAFDKLDFITHLDENSIGEVDLQNISDSLFIFDDIDQAEKKVCEKLTFFRDQLLELGRHHNISVINTAHLLTNYKKTRVMINEARTVTFFPASSFYNIKRFLKEYLGFGPKQIEKVKNTNSRWVTIYKNFPNFVMTEHEIYFP